MGPRQNLTRRQAHVLSFIRDYVQQNRISPTLEEIGRSLGINRVTVFEHVRALETKGWIRTSPHLSRSIQISDEGQDPSGRSLPILGRIAAGRPIEAIEDVETLDFEELFPKDRRCFVLRVVGDSMIDDHIRDGDLVVVESRNSATAGETVVALLHEQEVTLKRYYPMGPKVRLEPRNAAMQPMMVKAEDVRIQGVVVGVVRRY